VASNHRQSSTCLLHKCPVTHFAGSLMQLHQLRDEEAIAWMSRWSKAYEKQSKVSTCHPVEVTFPHLPSQLKLVLDLMTPEERKAELT